tara:strand:- start:131 stop:298 length:168 start_codon:yes stop_codon:yes gene_type:complete
MNVEFLIKLYGIVREIFLKKIGYIFVIIVFDLINIFTEDILNPNFRTLKVLDGVS